MSRDAAAAAELAQAFRETVSRLVRRMRRQAATGMPLMQMAVLSIAEQETLTVSEVAARERVRSQTITVVVDKLEERGLVARRRDERDGRAVRVAITTKGQRFLARRNARTESYLLTLVQTMSEEERQAFAKVIHVLDEVFDRGL